MTDKFSKYIKKTFFLFCCFSRKQTTVFAVKINMSKKTTVINNSQTFLNMHILFKRLHPLKKPKKEFLNSFHITKFSATVDSAANPICIKNCKF